MAVCTYDNPNTCQRECWKDGRLLCSYSMNLFFKDRFPIPAKHFFFGANIGPWIDGQLIGNKSAMDVTQPSEPEV